MNATPPLISVWLLRAAIASVWSYQGLWHKVLSTDDRHRRIVAEALGERIGPSVAILLGLLETALGIAVLLGWRPRLMAWAQIVLLVGMNGAGLLFAGSQIPDPAGMITLNFVFIMAIWFHGWLTASQAAWLADQAREGGD